MIRDTTLVRHCDGVSEGDAGYTCTEAPRIYSKNGYASPIVLEVLVQKLSEIALHHRLSVRIHHCYTARYSGRLERSIKAVGTPSERRRVGSRTRVRHCLINPRMAPARGSSSAS